MKTKIPLLLLIFNIVFFYSQEKTTEKQIDSITTALWNSKFFNDEGLVKLTELYYQAKEIGYEEGQIRLLKRIVEIKSSYSDFISALQYLKYLKSLSLSAQQYEEYTYANCLEAKIFFMDKNYSQAKKVLNLAEKYLYKIQDKEKRRKAKTEIYIYQWYNFEKSKLPKSSYTDSLLSISKKLYNEAVLIENNHQRAKSVLYSTNLMVNSLILLKKYEEAVKYLKIGGQELKTFGEVTYLGVDYYEAKGDVEYNFKHYKGSSNDSSLASYNKAIKIGEALGYTAKTKELYSKVAEIYREKKDYAKQALFLQKSSNLEDSIQIKENKGLSEVKPLLYANKGDITETPSQNRTLLYFLSAVALLTIVIGGRKLYFNKKKNKIQPLEKVTSEKDPVVKTNPYNHLISLALKNDSSFYLTFLEAFPDFSEKLLNINPLMKISDIEFCAYIKLNLETKQIAIMKKISVRAVEGKKYRIRKKLGISAEENMYIWFSKL
ncbi:hypothetical protein AR438_11685 [Chryseobacterium aquaticum]|uniref:HTH luxR-type domain-containing protein n=1 Tax=Chryseobacterium aquaticum TaxID=452084 RepID=A0A0Q3SLT5_9FLAO|nr:hypothetical protein [Chryseobacterium aquaticum]KQK26226.1 hypothetical protein AR438_11685 [Chryseobacterium aquaticum]